MASLNVFVYTQGSGGTLPRVRCGFPGAVRHRLCGTASGTAATPPPSRPGTADAGGRLAGSYSGALPGATSCSAPQHDAPSGAGDEHGGYRSPRRGKGPARRADRARAFAFGATRGFPAAQLCAAGREAGAG